MCIISLGGGGRRLRLLPSLSPKLLFPPVRASWLSLLFSPARVYILNDLYIPGISSSNFDVGVFYTLLPFNGEGLFTRVLIHFPNNDPITQRHKR